MLKSLKLIIKQAINNFIILSKCFNLAKNHCMASLDISLESILPFLEKLEVQQLPQWGSMSAQRMVEHLTDTLWIACGQNPQSLLVPEEKLPAMQAFLNSDKPMAKNIQVPFALAETPLRNEELELAIDEYVDAWLAFEECYESTPGLTHVHAYYGPLNEEGWRKLHSKHVTHHFEQFCLLGE